MKNVRLISALSLLMALSTLWSCTDDTDDAVNPTDVDVSAELDESYVSLAFDQIDAEVDNAIWFGGTGGGSNDRVAEDCRIIIRDEAAKQITVDFGSGCQGKDGKTRTGKILIQYEGNAAILSRTITVTLDGYTVDGNSIEGTRVTQFQGAENSEIVHTVSLTGGKITFAEGGEITRESSWTRTIRGGENVLEGELIVEGAASGTNREGVSYTMNVTTPIVKKSSCFAEQVPFPVSGVKAYTTSDGHTGSIDFGNGSCDNLAVVTINGFSKEIELGKPAGDE